MPYLALGLGGVAGRLIPYRRTAYVFVAHCALVPLGYWLSFLLRFDAAVPERYLALLWLTLPYLLVLRLSAFALFGLNRSRLRHSSNEDLVSLTKAITVSSAFFLLTLWLTGQLRAMPRSMLLLDWAVAILLFGGFRFGVRALRESLLCRRGTAARKRTLVIGAGSSAANFLHSHRSGLIYGIHPVGLVDDDPEKRRLRIHGIPVIGSTADIGHLVRRRRIQLLVIAIPSATREQMQRIVEHCTKSGAEFKIIPSLQDLLDGRTRPHHLREVEMEDLLGRHAVKLDLEAIERDIGGKVVLVSGGGGSIGSELARQIAAFHPQRLVLLEQAESPLYFTQLEISRLFPNVDVVTVLGSITDRQRLEQVFGRWQPNYVFHAAAYKHVPMLEANIVEALRTNVLGTRYVAEAAARHGVDKFVLISTDKAVYPSSVMGATKRIAERIVLGSTSLRNSDTDFRVVRFGNVLGSNGSVVPLFKRQLAAGGPLTVTHPDMTRYFMTIPEAAQLVLQAAALPEGAGRISMLEMGEPVRILGLAENLIRISGFEPYRDIPIVFTGIRPGEKLHEELTTRAEKTIPTSVAEIRTIEADEIDSSAVEQAVNHLTTAIKFSDEKALLAVICTLVPECSPRMRELTQESLEVVPATETMVPLRLEA